MELITGVHGKPHVTSAQHRAIFENIIGKGSYILNYGDLLEPELQSNQSLRIRSGVLFHHGSISEVKRNTYDEVTLINGSQGMKRVDLIVARYTKSPDTEFETMTWMVIQGTPSESNPAIPEYTIGNMQEGDLVDDCPVFEVHIEGIQVTQVVKLLDILDGNLAELNRKLSEKQDTITGGASTIASSNLATKRALISNSAGKVAVASTTVTELEYLHGVKSSVQNQLDNKNNLKCRTTTHMVAFEWTGDNKLLILVDNTVVATFKNGTNI